MHVRECVLFACMHVEHFDHRMLTNFNQTSRASPVSLEKRLMGLRGVGSSRLYTAGESRITEEREESTQIFASTHSE